MTPSPSPPPSEPTAASRTWEIEDKFAVVEEAPSRIERKLMELGFVSLQTTTFTDWYFDCNTATTNSSHNFVLVRQNCWLRYRKTTIDGMWQLKRGSKMELSSVKQGGGSSTVYEEVEGKNALMQAISLLDKHGQSNWGENPVDEIGISNERDPLPISRTQLDLLQRHNIAPFAKLTTTRTSWGRNQDSTSMSNGLTNKFDVKVDIDRTDDGYTVGEVEICVQDEHSIADARSDVCAIKALLIGHDDNGKVAESKLEHWLRHRRPEVLRLCKECAVL